MRGIANGTQVTALPTPAAAVGTPGYCNNTAPGPGVTPTNLYPDDVNILIAELMAILSAAGVSQDATGANTTQVLASLKLLFGPGRLLNIQVFGTAGTATYTPTTGTNSVVVEVLGAGGGGGGSAGVPSSSYQAAGGGGQAGGYAQARITSGFSGVTITVGAGGTSSAGATGGNGGTSSFGAIVSSPGGQGGQAMAATTGSNGAAGGGSVTSPSGGFLNAIGQPGGPGMVAASASYTISGYGGSSPYGAGAAGVGAGSAGGAASGYGGAGSGSSSGTTTALAGGVGMRGLVIVREYA